MAFNRVHRLQLAAAFWFGMVPLLACGANPPETEKPTELNPKVSSAQSEGKGEGPNQAACEQGVPKESRLDCEPSEVFFEKRCFSSTELACSCAGCLTECNVLESAPLQVSCPGQARAGGNEEDAVTDPPEQ